MNFVDLTILLKLNCPLDLIDSRQAFRIIAIIIRGHYPNQFNARLIKIACSSRGPATAPSKRYGRAVT